MSAVEADVAGSLRYRPVTPDELETCAHVWRRAIDDYIVRLGQPALPEEVGPLVRLYTHLQATDPERFVAAVRDAPDGTGEEIVGFGSAVVRESLWYLSMLFVLPGLQGAGIGRALLERIGPQRRRRRHVPGHGHGQRPAHQQRPVRLARGRAPHPPPEPGRDAVEHRRLRGAALGRAGRALRGAGRRAARR